MRRHAKHLSVFNQHGEPQVVPNLVSSGPQQSGWQTSGKIEHPSHRQFCREIWQGQATFDPTKDVTQRGDMQNISNPYSINIGKPGRSTT